MGDKSTRMKRAQNYSSFERPWVKFTYMACHVIIYVIILVIKDSTVKGKNVYAFVYKVSQYYFKRINMAASAYIFSHWFDHEVKLFLFAL